MAYIIKHVKREERPELPEEALREAVVNALAHRITAPRPMCRSIFSRIEWKSSAPVACQRG